jgi:L-asparaginase
MLMKRIYVAYTGGTFGMVPSDCGYAPKAQIAAELAELIKLAELGSVSYELSEYDDAIDSAVAGPVHWQVIVDDICARAADFDAFVIIHGTDTMAFAAAALSYALAHIEKPIVITGSQVPLNEPDSDASENFVGAMRIAAAGRPTGAHLYFGGQLFPGNSVTKTSAQSFEAFSSPAPLTVDDSAAVPVLPEAGSFRGYGSAQVGIVRIYPGMTAAQLARTLHPELDAVVLQCYGTGNVPTTTEGFLDVLERATATGTIVLAVSQCVDGGVDLSTYATGSALSRIGVISGGNLTTEAAFAKLHYLVACDLEPDVMRLRICEEVTRDIRGIVGHKLRVALRGSQ